MLFDDPEAPTTLKQHFDYGIFTGGPVTGSAVIDEGSIVVARSDASRRPHRRRPLRRPDRPRRPSS